MKKFYGGDRCGFIVGFIEPVFFPEHVHIVQRHLWRGLIRGRSRHGVPGIEQHILENLFSNDAMVFRGGRADFSALRFHVIKQGIAKLLREGGRLASENCAAGNGLTLTIGHVDIMRAVRHAGIHGIIAERINPVLRKEEHDEEQPEEFVGQNPPGIPRNGQGTADPLRQLLKEGRWRSFGRVGW